MSSVSRSSGRTGAGSVDAAGHVVAGAGDVCEVAPEGAEAVAAREVGVCKVASEGCAEAVAASEVGGCEVASGGAEAVAAVAIRERVARKPYLRSGDGASPVFSQAESLTRSAINESWCYR